LGETQIQVGNPNTNEISVVLDLLNPDGSLRDSTNRTIKPNGILSESFRDLYPSAIPSSSDYVHVKSQFGFVPFTLLGKRPQILYGLKGQDTNSGSKTLYSPQYVIGPPDWHSVLTIINLESGSSELTLTFLNDAGDPVGTTKKISVPGRGKLRITESDFFLEPSALTQGYVKIESSATKIAGCVVFGDPAGEVFSAALPLTSTLVTSAVFSQVVSNSTYFTGLALLNPNLFDAEVQVEVFGSDGVILASKILSIPPGHRISGLITQYFPSLVGQVINTGYIKVTSDRGVASFALFGTNNLSVLSAVPAQVLQ